MNHKLICLVGMCGAGKSEVADYLQSKRDFGFVRFGQLTLDVIKEMGEKPNEALEKKIREDLRKKHGMAAFAILNIPKFDKLLKKSDVIGDGLYSWEEYLVLKEKYGDQLVIIATFAPPLVRYARLENRATKHGADKNLRYRSFTASEAASRDKAEIENIHKAGPIAMADFTLINTGKLPELHKQINNILKEIYG
ncbi:MAG: AAA family ATPase [Candidatus Berkelbacteria bacterium]|nr:AAA family ATPase [Candidatus Berkelbacteria bacterium]